jgi:hypothetical protein
VHVVRDERRFLTRHAPKFRGLTFTSGSTSRGVQPAHAANVFLTGGDAGKRLSEQPGAQDVPPICGHGVQREGVEGEDSFGQSRDGGNRRLAVALKNGAVGLDQEKVMLGQHGITAIAKQIGLTHQTVYRIQDGPAGAEAARCAASARAFSASPSLRATTPGFLDSSSNCLTISALLTLPFGPSSHVMAAASSPFVAPTAAGCRRRHRPHGVCR